MTNGIEVEIENYPLEISDGKGGWVLKHFKPSHAQRIQMRADFNLYFRIPAITENTAKDESTTGKNRTAKPTTENPSNG